MLLLLKDVSDCILQVPLVEHWPEASWLEGTWDGKPPLKRDLDVARELAGVGPRARNERVGMRVDDAEGEQPAARAREEEDASGDAASGRRRCNDPAVREPHRDVLRERFVEAPAKRTGGDAASGRVRF